MQVSLASLYPGDNALNSPVYKYLDSDASFQQFFVHILDHILKFIVKSSLPPKKY